MEIPAEIDTPKFREKWAEWQAYKRQARHKKLTPMSTAAKLRELAAVGEGPAIAAIDKSISNGWQGIFPEKNVDRIASVEAERRREEKSNREYGENLTFPAPRSSIPEPVAACGIAAECQRRGLDDSTVEWAVGQPAARVEDALRVFDEKRISCTIRSPSGLFRRLVIDGCTPPQPRETRGYAGALRPQQPPQIENPAAVIEADRARAAAAYAKAEKNTPEPKGLGNVFPQKSPHRPPDTLANLAANVITFEVQGAQ